MSTSSEVPTESSAALWMSEDIVEVCEPDPDDRALVFVAWPQLNTGPRMAVPVKALRPLTPLARDLLALAVRSRTP
jgi:hypothetical protein